MNKEELEKVIDEGIKEYETIEGFVPLPKVFLSDKLPQEEKEFYKDFFRGREIVWYKPIKFIKGDEK